MFIIPEYIEILGIRYKVVFTEDEDDWERRGSTMLDKGIININPKMNSTIQVKTFLHEVLEAINNELNIELQHQQINLLEAGLFQVFSCNPIFNSTNENERLQKGK